MNQPVFETSIFTQKMYLKKLQAEATNNTPLLFLLKWTIGRPVSLFSLHGRLAGTGPFKSLIPAAVNDTDGEIAVQIGHFPLGTVIELRFAVFALEDVPKAAVFIVRPGLVEPFRPPQPGTTQAIKRTEPWRDGGEFKV